MADYIYNPQTGTYDAIGRRRGASSLYLAPSYDFSFIEFFTSKHYTADFDGDVEIPEIFMKPSEQENLDACDPSQVTDWDIETHTDRGVETAQRMGKMVKQAKRPKTQTSAFERAIKLASKGPNPKIKPQRKTKYDQR